MGWLIFFGVIFAILGILMIPVHVVAEYKESLTLDIKYLFFRKRIIPGEKKEEKTEEKKPETKEQKPKEQKPKRKRTLVENVDMVLDIIHKYGPGAKMILRNIRFHELTFYWKVTGEDAADCGIKYGKACAWVNGVLAAIQNLIKVEHPKIKVFPDFLGTEDEIYGGVNIEFNPLIVFIGLIRMGFVYLKDIFKNSKKRRRASAKRHKIQPKESIKK